MNMLDKAISPYKMSFYVPSAPTLVLLHGGPGVGKTTAGRYAAEYTRRPLLSISSADIVKDDGNAEETLKRILDRAERWKAILLLENVELMFSEISAEISHRDLNLVLVIRALEAHRGLVFLTTQRIGRIDTNVLSRITVPIEFPELDTEVKLKILEDLVKNSDLETYMDEDDVTDWHEHDIDTKLNGWNIKNAFNAALNFYSNSKSSFGAYLRLSIKSQIELKDYLIDTIGTDEGKQASPHRYRR